VRYHWQVQAIRIAATVVLVGVGAALTAAGQAPDSLPGIPDIGPPATAPIGSPSAPTPPPAAPSAPAPVAAPAATPAEVPAAPAAPTLSPEEHYARGEVQFGGAWTPIDNLFKDYLASRAELQDAEAKATTARDGISTIQAQINAMKSESLLAEQPIRKDISKQTAKHRELTKASEAQPPPRPRLLQNPQRPRTYGGGASAQSDQAMQDWQAQMDAVTRANDAMKEKYKADYDQWKKAKDTADKELPKIDQALKDLQAKIDQNNAALITKQAPLLEKIKAANEEARGMARKIEALQTRIKGMADALLAAPETLRFKHGILEWEGVFWRVADLEKLLADTQAEIDRVTRQMKAEGKAPEGWRHPQQDRMDALGKAIARAKAAAHQ